MIHQSVSKTAEGVAVRLTGDVKKAAFESVAAQCSGGDCRCECDSNLKERVKELRVSGADGDLTLTLKGEGLEPEAVAAAMRHCDMEAMQ